MIESKEEPLHVFVPKFRIDETLAQIRECLEKGWTGLGFKTVEFEKAWCEYTHLPHSHFLCSATAGLHMAVRMLKEHDGWKDGDEIISTPLTFVSTNHAILYENLTPVFADVDRFLCLDPDSIEKRITDRTRAVMFVGVGGNTGQLRRVIQICKARKLRLILDAAHMGGTRWSNGVHVGAEADVTVFSYQAVKNLPTADAGMICFREKSMDEAARKWSWLGISKDTFSRTVQGGAYKWKYDVEHVGFKYHGNSIMAGIALVSLKYLDADNAYRRQLGLWYDQALQGTPGVDIVPMSDDCESSRHLYQIMVDQRDQAILALNNMQIFPGVHYNDNSNYRMYASQAGQCPNAARASDRLITLPIHMNITRNHVQRIAAAVRTIVSGSPKNNHHH